MKIPASIAILVTAALLLLASCGGSQTTTVTAPASVPDAPIVDEPTSDSYISLPELQKQLKAAILERVAEAANKDLYPSSVRSVTCRDFPSGENDAQCHVVTVWSDGDVIDTYETVHREADGSWYTDG